MLLAALARADRRPEQAAAAQGGPGQGSDRAREETGRAVADPAGSF
jgi:hypothetical protein